MTKNTDRNDTPTEEVSDVVDESVDSRPAEPVEETPDSAQAAEPVDNQGEVVGRRNEELPLDNTDGSVE
jgi:hypothetical protein